MNEEILLRNDATLTDVDVKLRIIDLIAVPWEQVTDVVWRGESWKEVFACSAFDGLEASAGRIIVNREHTKGDTVGKVVRVDTKDARGLITQVKIAATPRGDETLALAAEDMIAPSVGYFVKRASDVDLDKQTRMRRVRRAFLDHLSLVESPAYEGARVLAVRAGSPPLVEDASLPATPNLDALLSDGVIAEAIARAREGSKV